MSDLPIAVSTGPHTRPCVDAAVQLLKVRGQRLQSYEADGRGGRALEGDVLAGRIAAVVDLTLTELLMEMLGVPGRAGPDRLTAAALRGIPQIIALGGLEIVSGRPTTPEENDRLGREIAHKASAARGPTTILVPLRSVSPILVRSLGNWLSPNIRIRELDLLINDPAFATAVVAALDIEDKS